MKRLNLAVIASGLLSLIALATPAYAEWRVAETENFIYYSEAPPEELRQTVSRMQTFDRLVRALTGNKRPSSPLKVVIFEVADMDEVNNTFPFESQGVGGYYSTTSQGPFLVTFRNTLRTSASSMFKASRQSYNWGPEVRQHEYLHHYMYQYFNTNYPSWYSEGFAEYYGTMAFPEPNVVEIGHAPYFRIDTIRSGGWLHVEKLLTAKSYADVGDQIGQLYAEGWLLTHLAASSPERGKQLQAYLTAVASGTPYEKAATDAFGDLDQLNRELRKHRDDFQAMRLALKPTDDSAIPVRELEPLESDLMRYQIRLYSGFAYADLPQIISHVKNIRAADPDNLMGLRVQVQLENLAGQHAGALETATRLLATQPGDITGLTHLGIASAGLLDAQSDSEAWDQARAPLLQAIKASPTAIEPRVALFKTYLDQGVLPSAAAQNHLVEAFNLLPSNSEIRYLLARDFEQRDLIEDAIAVIKPAAFGAFDGADREKARRERQLSEAAELYTSIAAYESPRDMLKRLEAKLDGRWDESTGTVTTVAAVTTE
jgi:tetratricopeptide (TPR) repeat protein